ncbi:MAG: NAD-dependent epimerase/dehydratase family protein [Planctomycetes bacterium]|nr:NAD-dependent epimerase/dehydratase family protein [Planctomycetota bacterium]
MTSDPSTTPASMERFRGASALVTGGAGFIGSHIVDALLAAGARVRVLDDLSTGDRRNVPAGAELMVGSVSDVAAVGRAVTGCTHVFHLAAMVGIAQSVHEPERHFETNIAGTERVLQACAAAKVSSVVFASSSAVYGLGAAIPSRESDPVVAASPYAGGKAAGELLVESHARTHDTHAASLRLFNVFGPRQNPTGAYAAAIAAFLSAAKLKKPAQLFGSGAQTRDFVPVANVARAFLLASDERLALRGERFNIGLGRETSLKELLSMIAEIASVKVAPLVLPPREADSPRSCSDISKARAKLGYEPRVSMDEGLRETWRWMLSNAA